MADPFYLKAIKLIHKLEVDSVKKNRGKIMKSASYRVVFLFLAISTLASCTGQGFGELGHTFIKTEPFVYKGVWWVKKGLEWQPAVLSNEVVDKNVGNQLPAGVKIQFDDSWDELQATAQITNVITTYGSVKLDHNDYLQQKLSEQIEQKFSGDTEGGAYRVSVSIYEFQPKSYAPSLYRTQVARLPKEGPNLSPYAGKDYSGYYMLADYTLKYRLTIRDPKGKPIVREILPIANQYYPNIQASAIYGNKHKVAAEALTKVMFSLVAKDMCGKIAEVLRGIDDTGQS